MSVASDNKQYSYEYLLVVARNGDG